MHKKVLSWILTVSMVLSLIVALPVTANAQPPEFNCIITETSVEYETLGDALAAVTDGQTIQLLANVTYDAMIAAFAKSFTLDVDGFTLTVNAVNATCLYAGNEYDLTVTDSGSGGSVVLSSSGGVGLCGIYAYGYGSEISVDVPTTINVTGTNCYGVYAVEGGVVSVTGDITATGTNCYGAGAQSGVYGSLITIDGEIDSTNYINANGTVFTGPEQCITPTTKTGYLSFYYSGDSANPQSTVWVKEVNYVCEVDGTPYMTFDEGLAAAAVDWDTIILLANIDYDGQLTTTFDTYINLNGYTLNVVNDAGIGLRADGYDLDIYGEGELNVTGTTYGVYTCDGGSAEITNAVATAVAGKAVYVGDSYCAVTVFGNATADAENGVAVYAGDSPYCTALVYGNVSAQGTNGTGASAIFGGSIEIRGDITATNYISVGGTVKIQSEFSSDDDGYYVYTNTGNTVQVKHVICSIGETDYKWLSDALDAAADGDTITLLDDIVYGADIILTDMDITIDLDTYVLDIGWTGSDGALEVDGATLAIDDTAGGEFNIIHGYSGVRATNGGTATVTSISGLNGYGVIGESGGSVTVTGDISVLSYMGSGFNLSGGAAAIVYGNVYSLNGISVSGEGSSATIEGSLFATSGNGIEASSGGTVAVKGNVTAGYRGVSAYGWSEGGGNVHVFGNVSATNYYGVEASAASEVVVDGDVQSKKGLLAIQAGTAVTVNGDITTTDIAEYGASALQGGLVTVNGEINAANYVLAGATAMAEEAGVLHGHYTVYTDGESTVRTTGYVFFKDDCEGELGDNWIDSNSGWIFSSSLFNPEVTPHDGSKVAVFQSYQLATEYASRLYLTDSLNLSVGTEYWLEFWMYHDTGLPAYTDYIIAQISTDGGLTWSDLATVYRYDESAGWKKESFDLSAYAGLSNVKIAFLGVSDYGMNIFLDDISVSHECMIEGCSVTEAYGGFISTQEIYGETYYEVGTAEQLAHINEHLDLNYIQTADIDLSTYNGGRWIPIGGYGDPDYYSTPDYFTGNYLGNGFEIQNLYCYFNDESQNACSAGLFAYISGIDALVSNLTVTVVGADLTCYNYGDFGGIATTLSGGTIQNCDVIIKGDVITRSPNGDVGGIVGSAQSQYDSESDTYIGSIDGCTVTLESGSLLTDGWSKWTGGIAGSSQVTITDCNVIIEAGECIKAPMVGGIAAVAGKAQSISDCTVTGEGSLAVFPQKYYDVYIGGIAGYCYETEIENCYNEVLVDATNVTKINQGEQAYAGGITGYVGSMSMLSGCINSGEVWLTIADNVVDYYDVSATPEGDEYAYAGGIAGYVYGYSQAVTIENCENNADVISVNLVPTLRAYAGGIAGHIDSANGDYSGVTLLNCANIGLDKTVSATGATTMSGGIAGATTYTDFESSMTVVIQNCYNQASVLGENNGVPAADSHCTGIAAGGIIGAAGEVTIKYCYSTALNVSAVNDDYGDAYEGGLFGLLYNTSASQNYCETNINVSRAAGAIVDGMNIIAESDRSGAYECATAAQLKTKAFYGNGWRWYVSGGTSPDFYSSTNPWRMAEVNSYPVLKGTAYTVPSSGGVITTYYDITATSGQGGAISPAGTIEIKAFGSKSFTITPESGYVISDVLVDGVSVGAVAAYTFSSVKGNHTIYAVFESNTPDTQGTPFTDVNSGMWYFGGINFVYHSGLFNGITETTFEPDTTMTRAMLITVLWRLDGQPGADFSELFADVEAGIWYSDAVIWAAENGIVEGFDGNVFIGNDPITREQMAAILYRYASFKGYDVTASDDLSGFGDAADVSAWAVTAVQWAVAQELITGVSETQLDPGGNASRAQVATILMRFIENNA